MPGFAAYSTLLPRLQAEWGMSNSQAGLVSGAFFAGYMAAVPVLSTLTDQIDARRIYLVSCAVLIAALGSFAWLAEGTLSAALLQGFAGLAIAGTYMPGLRLLTDNTSGASRSRAVSFYTAVFGLGTSFSILLSGFVADLYGWRAAFAAAAAGPIFAAVIVLARMPRSRRAPAGAAGRLFDFAAVMRRRAVRPYIIGYALHCWELFGSRTWLVAFCVFAQGSGEAWPWSPVVIAAIANMFGPPASIGGNEAALRFGRQRVIALMMTVSGILTCVLGFAAWLPWFLIAALAMLHMTLVMGDSSTLTAGMVEHADPAMRGATMAMHSMLGFGAGFAAPLAFGAALDLGGGNASPLAWGLGFATLGIGVIVLPLVMRWPR